MFGKVFGANVDWISQHSVLPEYFRQQFYATGNLFPEFAANIGGGQNIYNFAYYGLYSPLILPSYFLPFVKMSDYIMAVSLLCLAANVLLFYRWLRENEVSKGNAFLTSMMFLLAGPMIFHSYNQIMFVNYMPFLLLGLMGVDRYFRKKKSGLLTGSIFLMIMTSFYFSIGGLLVLVLYGIYRYLEVQEIEGKTVTIHQFLLDGMKFCLPVLYAVLLSGVLLVPTAMALLQGTRGEGKSVGVADLFFPEVDLLRALYHPYGIGLTTLVITVLLTGLTYRGWREKYLHIVCMVVMMIPFFLYVLNGGLYIRSKVLIPMLPLLCYLISIYLEKQKKGEIPFLQGMIPYVLTVGIVWMGGMEEKHRFRSLLMLDAIVMLLCGGFFYGIRRLSGRVFHKKYRWKHAEKMLILFPIGCLFVFGIGCNLQADRMLDASFYRKVTDTRVQDTVEQILEQEEGFYRMEQHGDYEEDAANLNRIWSMQQYSSSIYSSTYEEEYQKFRQKVFGVEEPYRNILMQPSSRNPMFQRLMGVKYLVSEKEVPGYEKVSENIYENQEVLPIAYTTNQMISEAAYETLPFPYNQTTFLSCAVTGEGGEITAEHLMEMQGKQIQKFSASLDSIIQTEEKIQWEIPIPRAKEGNVLFLQFRVKNQNPSKDVSVWVEGIRNKLTAKEHIYYNDNEIFTYAVPLREGQETVSVTLGAGTYEISDLQSYLWKYDKEVSEKERETLCQGEFLPDKKKTKGNVIAGSVESKEDGYLITSIPYDENFEVYIDGKRVKTEKVNTEFLGAPMKKGRREVKVIYHAPGLKLGKGISLFGCVLFLGRGLVKIKGCKRGKEMLC